MIRLLFFLLKFLRWEMVCLKSGCWHNRLTEHRLCLMNNDDVLCEFLRVKKGILNDVVSIKGSMAPQRVFWSPIISFLPAVTHSSTPFACNNSFFLLTTKHTQIHRKITPSLSTTTSISPSLSICGSFIKVSAGTARIQQLEVYSTFSLLI